MTSRSKSTISSKLARRDFVTICGAGAVFPGTSLSADEALPTNPDVVIIGAGAAGIAAAHVLQKQGLSFVHLEASDRVGGRAFTETSTFGVPYDHGAHWVQNQRRNPYFQRAVDSGNRFYKSPEEYTVYAEDRLANNAEEAEFWDAMERVEKAISKAGKRGMDVAPADVLPTDGDWMKTAWFAIGAWEMGKDMEDFSCSDWWNSSGSTDWYYADGYGALVRDHAVGLTVALNTPVTKLKWGGSGVQVETPRGVISARAVILTVSTAVLADQGIVFDPPMPVKKQESFHGISMGYYNHIAIQLSADIFGMGEDGYVFHKVSGSDEAFGALTNTSGTGLTYCDVGGRFARELELAGQDVAIDFVSSKLRDIIGTDFDKRFVAGAASDWGNDPLYKGCYASAKPGAAHMREVLREPVGDRIFFAGEACHEDLWATVGGADISGRDVAKTVSKILV